MMRAIAKTGPISLAIALMMPGCQKAGETPDAAPAPLAAEQPPPAPAMPPASWPDSLNVIGDGYPNPGDPCRRIGESAATVDFLDHTATLAGCLSAADAAALGGTVVATADGVSLVSVPAGTGRPGDGDSQGDALVAGTRYHATGQIRCSGYEGAAPGMCAAGVVRNPDTGAVVDVTLPGGVTRTIMFNPDGSFLTFSTSQADGTAAMEVGSRREGDTIVATLGTERYEIPDVLIVGD